jgi:hypothetical protein
MTGDRPPFELKTNKLEIGKKGKGGGGKILKIPKKNLSSFSKR